MSHNEELSSLNNQMAAFKNEIESQIQSGLARERKLEKERESLVETINDLKIKISNLEHNLSEKDKEVAAVKNSEERTIQEITELSKFIKEYTSAKEKDCQELRNQISGLQQENSDLKVEYEARLADTLKSSSKESQAMQSTVDHLKSTI